MCGAVAAWRGTDGKKKMASSATCLVTRLKKTKKKNQLAVNIDGVVDSKALQRPCKH